MGETKGLSARSGPDEPAGDDIAMLTRSLFPGCLLRLGIRGEYGHHLGGVLDVPGADCPNCHKPLMLHAALDTRDPRLAPVRALGVRGTVPLLYCMRCDVMSDWFSYRVIDNARVELVEVPGLSGVDAEEYYEIVESGDVLPHLDVSLEPLPRRLQELNDLLNDKLPLSEAEGDEYVQLADPPRPHVWPVNQVGGRAFLIQRLVAPLCPSCSPDPRAREDFMYQSINARLECRDLSHPHQMAFLAALTNDRRAGFVLHLDGVQVIFFVCTRCWTITARHSF